MSSPLTRVLAEPVRAQARPIIASCVLSVLRIGADLARPWPLALGIDYAIEGRVAPTPLDGLDAQVLLVLAGVSTVVVTTVSGVLDTCAERLGERAAERVGAALRADLFARSLTLSLRWHQRVRSGELVSRLTSDVGRLLDGVVATCVTLVPDLISLGGVLLLLLFVDPGLAGLGLLVVPVLAVVAVRQRRAVKGSQTAARAASGRLAATTTDLIRNVAAVQAFGRGDDARRVFSVRNHELLGVSLGAVDAEARWAPAHRIVLAVGAGLVLVTGGLQVRAGAQTTGHLLVVLAYLAELYAPVRSLTRLSVVLAKASASAERVEDILATDDVVADAPSARPLRSGLGRLELERVRFGYDAERPVLDGLDLVVHRGETVCLFGPSGVGKSTVLSLILRLWDVDAGRVLFDGVDVRDLQLRSLREQIAYVPQDPWLLDATIAENIAFGSRSATRADVIAAARETGVDEFVERLALGYDEPLGEGGVRLSGGQRRRVALARAAVSPATLLLLDEPTASLDGVAAARVAEAVRAAATRRTTVLVTHDENLARMADRVVHLEATGLSDVVGPVTTTTTGRR